MGIATFKYIYLCSGATVNCYKDFLARHFRNPLKVLNVGLQIDHVASGLVRSR
jgi:hypothetical protein